ncbi:MAG TPA: co-chaperone GroES [Armatimonadota bacterium]|nr:co-chaperone GroES [Armatimonadota bacterium]
MKLQPLGQRILVQRLEPDAVTPGGIVLPEGSQEKPIQGEVIEIGEGGRDDGGNVIPMRVSKGARVLFGLYAGTEVKFNGLDYLIMDEADVLAVITGA